MATIRGTARADQLWGTDAVDQFYGGKGGDEINAGSGDWAIGGQGNNQLFSAGTLDASDIYHSATNVTLIGGAGHDTIWGFGALRGDEQAGVAERYAGNDTLVSTMDAETELGTQRGGKGHDTFNVGMHADGHGSELDVLDFRAGEDKVAINLTYAAPGNWLPPATLFAVLDTNGNGRLGDDVPLDGNSETWSDTAGNRLVIRVHEDHVVFNGVTHLDASDWQF